MIKIAINGFGRIGRPVLKVALEKGLSVVAINDLADVENLAYLLKYDSVYGKFDKEVEVRDGNLVIDEKEIKVFQEKDPNNLPWKDLEVDAVFECTGIFKDRESTSSHIKAGAKKVFISAPTKDETIKTIVMGVNEHEIEANNDILANASCTTNCLAPIMRILEDNFGVEKSLMSTIHSYTSTQSLVDSPAKKDFRRGRSAAQNIIPTSTGAAQATGLVVPEVRDNFDGMAFRVPTVVGSVCDITCILKKDATVEEINLALENYSKENGKDILKFSKEPLVSSDIIKSSHSSVVQGELTKVTGGNMVKIVAWYDNEWGYTNRLVDLAIYAFQK